MDLKAVDIKNRSNADQDIIKLIGFVRDISRKIDNLEDADEPLGGS